MRDIKRENRELPPVAEEIVRRYSPARRVQIGAMLIGLGLIALLFVPIARLSGNTAIVIALFGGLLSGTGLVVFLYRDKGEKETSSEESKTCPYCAETVRAKAIKCRYCGADLDLPEPVPGTPKQQQAIVKRNIQIGSERAFHEGEKVQIEAVSPDPSRQEYKYVVMSKNLNKRFLLSDNDIRIM